MEALKHKKIKNRNYLDFLDNGIIDPILEEADIIKVLDNIKHSSRSEARALVILLYYTGCRPVEALNMVAKDITKKGRYIIAKIPASKRGLARSLHLYFTLPLVKELYKYACGLMPERYLFYSFKGSYKRTTINKKGIPKTHIEQTDKLRYWIYKWFSVLPDLDTLPPYYLRHNRFSKLALAGASDRELRQFKGSKTAESIAYYTHLSSERSKKLARINK